MRKLFRALSVLILAVFVSHALSIDAQDADDSDLAGIITAARSHIPNGINPANVQTYIDGIVAYIYGYPLVTIAMTERVSTNVEYANQQLGRAPINQLYRAEALPVGSTFKDVVLPSTTTMYATGFYNLQKEPLILRIPAIGRNRFFIVQLLDAWTNVSRRSPGSRLSSATPGDYALVGPDWTGDLPGGLAGTIHFDTNTAWQIMRVLTTGTTDDQNLVYDNIFKPLVPVPLSKYGTGYTPPDSLPTNPSIDVVTQPVKQVDSMDACAFFGNMSAMMMSNPPRRIDAALVPILKRLGIFGTDSSGKPLQFSCANLTGSKGLAERTALQFAVATSKQILDHTPPPSLTPTNWSVTLGVGDYGVRYLLRAEVAKNALGANRPKDAVYGYGTHDSAGTTNDHTLNGTNNYVMHFKAPTAQKAPEQIPPVDGNGFWSLTLYNMDGTLVDNNKGATYHALGTNGTHPREVEAHFSCPNADGSLDVYVQPTPPTDAKQLCNWLEPPPPSDANPKAQFILFLRMYWPDAAITNGHWYPPGIDKN